MADLMLGCLLAGALLLSPTQVLAQHSVVGGKPAATGKAAAANVMALEEKFSDMVTAIKLVKNGDKDLAAYLSDPDNKCTVFLPTSQAMAESIRWLGKYAGKAGQNATLARSTLNYYVVPGMALTADEVGKKATRALTRANETVYMTREKGKPFVYARPDLPVALNRTDVRAGNCIVHTIGQAMVPPTANSMVQGWLEEMGTMPATRPKAQWAPQQKPLPESLEARPADATAAAAPAPAKSSGSSSRGGRLAWLVAAAAAVAAAADCFDSI